MFKFNWVHLLPGQPTYHQIRKWPRGRITFHNCPWVGTSPLKLTRGWAHHNVMVAFIPWNSKYNPQMIHFSKICQLHLKYTSSFPFILWNIPKMAYTRYIFPVSQSFLSDGRCNTLKIGPWVGTLPKFSIFRRDAWRDVPSQTWSAFNTWTIPYCDTLSNEGEMVVSFFDTLWISPLPITHAGKNTLLLFIDLILCSYIITIIACNAIVCDRFYQPKHIYLSKLTLFAASMGSGPL